MKNGNFDSFYDVNCILTDFCEYPNYVSGEKVKIKPKSNGKLRNAYIQKLPTNHGNIEIYLQDSGEKLVLIL